MKRIAVIAMIIAYSLNGYPQDSDKEPKALLDLRQKYLEQTGKTIIRETKPVREGYVEKLCELERKLADKKDYAGALAVRKEIDVLTGAQEKKQDAKDSAIYRQIVGNWRYTRNDGTWTGIFEFFPDGSMGGSKSTWKIKKDMIRINWDNGAWEEFVFPLDANKTVVNSWHGGKGAGIAVKVK